MPAAVRACGYDDRVRNPAALERRSRAADESGPPSPRPSLRRQATAALARRSTLFERLKPHARYALLGKAERPGGGKRKIDDASVDERPAVVDADDYRATVLEVCHAQASSERQGGMRRGHRVLVVSLAARGSLSLMALPVPGGIADLGSIGAEGRARRPHERARARRKE